jgi:DEAD/DEAH box helicase domain-containing protein
MGGVSAALLGSLSKVEAQLNEAAQRLEQAGRLRRRGDGLVWTRPYSPAAQTSLRTAGNEQFLIVEAIHGEVIGTVERERVFRFCHPGAVYLHLGRSYRVKTLDLEGRTVLVDDFDGAFYTQAKTEKNVLIAGQAALRQLPGATLFFGQLEVTEQVIAYLKRDMTDGHVLDNVSLDLPEQTFATQAFWLAMPQAVADKAVATLAETDELALPGALHAAEHALIALLPLYAMCDRWDIGGLSTPWHWQTDTPSIFVYDGYPGGIGLTKRGYQAFESLAADARSLIMECPCENGCPSCVQSPKCGNLNEPLSKPGAVALLSALSDAQ